MLVRVFLASLASLVLLFVFSDQGRAEVARIAVAANFTAAAKEIGRGFEAESGHRLKISFGSTGKLYAQIIHGAPFDLFLAADQASPQKLEEDGLAVRQTRFTYATGRIVLYSNDPALIDSKGLVLTQPGRFTRIAIANPKTAPYGRAAVEALQALGSYKALRTGIVMGENALQTLQFVITGNVQVGLVSLAQTSGLKGGSRWLVPANLYRPIRQDVVLLRHGRHNKAAKAFHAYLQSDKAREIIRRFGYGTGRE